MSRIGLISTTVHEGQNAMALRDASIKYGVAQAIGDGIFPDESGACVRNIYPSMDFAMPPEADSWKWKHPHVGQGAELWHQIISVNSSAYNRDRSVLVIYGLCNLSLIKNRCYATRIDFLPGRVKRTEMIPLDQFENGYTWMSTPIIFKKNDAFGINLQLNEHASEQTDFLKLIGVCIEPLGQSLSP